MANILKLLLVSTTSCTLLACASHYPSGALYTAATFPNQATAERLGSLRGTACAYSILGLVAWGDASTEAAMRDGHISSLSTLDTEHLRILAYHRYCSVAYGN